MAQAAIGSRNKEAVSAEERVAAAHKRVEARNRRVRWGLVAPALVIVGIFGIAPLMITIVYSFMTSGTYGGIEWVFSTASYVQFLFERDLFDDEVVHFTTAYLQIYGRSILLAFITTVFCLLLGFPTAYFMATRPESQRNFWLFLITLPFWTNLLIRTYAILIILRDDGLVNDALLGMGLIGMPIPIIYTNAAILIGLIYSFLPFMVLPLYAAMERMDFRLVEAGYDLYANRWKVLWRVIIPLAKPGIVAGCILVFIPSIGAYVTPLLLGGGKELMIGNLIALQFQGARNWAFGCAAALILMVLVMGALVLYMRNATAKQGALHG